MEAYQSIKQSPISNRIVKELNASVCSATFPSQTGVYKADLYSSKNSSDTLVFHGSCAPIHAEFVKTVVVAF